MPITFSGGFVANGVATLTLDNGSTVTISGFRPGAQSTVSGQAPFGAVSGTGFLSADSSFFFANLSAVGAPSQVAVIQGGIPVTSAATTVSAANQVLAFNVQADAALQSSIPFIRNNAGGNLGGPVGSFNAAVSGGGGAPVVSGSTVTPVYVYTPTGTLATDPTGANSVRTLQASLALSGDGPTQQSVIATHVGTVAAGPNGPQIAGQLRGSSLVASGPPQVLVTGAVNSIVDGNGSSLYGTNGLSGFSLAPTSPNFASEVPVSQAATTYNFNQPATRTNTPAGIGADRTFIPAVGSFGGVIGRAIPPSPPNAYVATGQTAFTPTGPGTFKANFVTDNGAGVNDLNMNFGGNATSPNSAFIDRQTFGAVEGSSQLVNGNTIVVTGDPAAAGRLYLLSGNTAPLPTGFMPDSTGNVCATCQFLDWGYWGGQLLSGNATNTNINRVDSAHINFWVAGQPTPAVSLPAVGAGGTGFYTGNAVGAVNNNGNRYLASGSFNLNYNFSALTGTYNLNNFDPNNRNVSASGTVNGARTNGAPYTGTLNGTGAFVGTGTVGGNFFGPGTAGVGGVPPETGGYFSLGATPASGAPYIAGGIFAGRAGPGT